MDRDYKKPHRYKDHNYRRGLGSRGPAGLFATPKPEREGEPWEAAENEALVREAEDMGAFGGGLSPHQAHELARRHRRSEHAVRTQLWKIKHGTPEAPARKRR